MAFASKSRLLVQCLTRFYAQDACVDKSYGKIADLISCQKAAAALMI